MHYKSLLIIFLTLFWKIVFCQTSVSPAGSGTQSNPYLIATLNNLYWLSQNPNEWVPGKYYIQTADIDASATSNWNSGAGFTPIGNSSRKFFGNYDGNGKKIENIYINRGTSLQIGFFGYTNSPAVISNIGLINVNITGKQYVGGLVGFMGGGTITKCYTSGAVKSNYDITSYGGLVGLVWGDEGNNLIKECYSLANVTAGGYNLGGLVGGNWGSETSAIIQDCYSRGNVTRILNSSFTETGAFCGYNNGGKIIRCYSTGNVYFNGVSSPTGSGFIGKTVSGAIQQDNFWDNDASNQTSAIGATSKTTSQMKSQGTFTNWDFVTPIWSIVQGINDGYPIQQGIISLPVTWQSFTATEQGSGALLQWSTASEQNTKDFVVEYSTNAMSWSPIGTVAASGNSSSLQYYSMLHKDPVKGQSVHFYRIQQRDLDGKFSYSKIVRLQMSGAETGMLVYPNPAKDVINVYLSQPQELRIISITGAEVWRNKLPAGNHQIEVGHLLRGMYIVATPSKQQKVVLD
ncbi:MAG: GLUG motif-containing protein [Chitinophagaceae bacterium]